MNRELTMVQSLRRVLESAGSGAGMCNSLVKELGPLDPIGRGAARMLLLGFPLSVSLRPLADAESEEVGMLASLILSSPKSSTALVGRRGEKLASTLERWVKLKENWRLEQKVLRFRSLMTSGVLGAVSAMVGTLGPLVGSLNFTGPAVQGMGNLLPAAAALTAVSAGMLGLFMSGRGMFVNIAVALAAFLAVSTIASPLANLPTVSLWGIK